jgi:hypothetical protein
MISSEERIETYIDDVLSQIQAKPAEKQRIETDLRAHIQAALESDGDAGTIFERMGNPSEVAAAFMAETSFQYASFWSRLWAALLDMLIIFVGAALLALFGIGTANLVPQTLPDPNPVQLLVAGLLVLLTVGAGLGAKRSLPQAAILLF